MMFRMNSNNACAASAACAEASFSCADKMNTVIMGAIMASIIICRASLRRLCDLLAAKVRESVVNMNTAVRTAA